MSNKEYWRTYRKKNQIPISERRRLKREGMDEVEKALKREVRNQKLRERYHTDADFREHWLEYKKAWYKKQKEMSDYELRKEEFQYPQPDDTKLPK